MAAKFVPDQTAAATLKAQLRGELERVCETMNAAVIADFEPTFNIGQNLPDKTFVITKCELVKRY